jgi:hypothetical protein
VSEPQVTIFYHQEKRYGIAGKDRDACGSIQKESTKKKGEI